MKKNTLILAGFIIVKFLLQCFLINPTYDLQRDEYLHLDQANHLAWGFQSVPPVTSWISFIIQLLGNSVFWIKFFPALFGALTIAVVWKTIKALKGNLFALILGATCVLFSALLRLNCLFQPNSLDVLCWTTFYFIILKYVNNDAPKWLFMASLVFAIGFLNKYNIVFLLIGILPALLLTEQRKIFARKNLWLAVLAALLLISPNLLWQYQHNFPVFYHLKELTDTQLINVNRLDFLKEQVFYFAGSMPVVIAALYGLLFYKPFRKYRFFCYTIIFTLAVFIFLRAKGYYAMGLYPIYISFGAVILGDTLNTGWKKYLRLVVIVIPVILYCLLFNVFFSIKSPGYIIGHQKAYKKLGLLRWEDGKDHSLPQDFADMLGWKELAEKTDSVLGTLPNSEHTLILCDNYGQAGAINYYSTYKKIRAVSFNADYINWFPFDSTIHNFIRVKEFDGSSDEMQKTRPFFDTGFVAGSITNPLAREFGTTIFVFSNPKIDINQRLKTEMNKIKSNR